MFKKHENYKKLSSATQSYIDVKQEKMCNVSILI